MTTKTYDVAKFCAKCNETIWSHVYFQCGTCTAIKYYLCESCELQGKFKFHAEGQKHKLIEFPIVVSAPKNVQVCNPGHYSRDYSRGLSGGDR